MLFAEYSFSIFPICDPSPETNILCSTIKRLSALYKVNILYRPYTWYQRSCVPWKSTQVRKVVNWVIFNKNHYTNMSSTLDCYIDIFLYLEKYLLYKDFIPCDVVPVWMHLPSLLTILPDLQQNVLAGCLTFVPHFRSKVMIRRKDKYLLKLIHPSFVLFQFYI